MEPTSLYLSPKEWALKKETSEVFQFHPLNFAMSSDKGKFLMDANVVPGIDLTEMRQKKDVNIYSELIRKAKKLAR